MPAVVRRVFGGAPQFDGFTHERAGRIAVFPLPANPAQPRPSPHGAVVGLAEAVAAAGETQNALDERRRLMPFAQNLNHCVGLFERIRALPATQRSQPYAKLPESGPSLVLGYYFFAGGGGSHSKCA